MQVPVIDCDIATRDEAAIARDVDEALREVGFMALTDIGVDQDMVARMFSAAREFFARPQQSRLRSAYGSAAENFGYQGFGQESLDPARPSDLKETFTMRNLLEAPVALQRWPDEAFRDVSEAFYQQAMAAALRLQRLMTRNLGVPTDFFTSKHSGENVTLRLLHYPPVAADAVAHQQMGAGAHTDYGMLTLLWQDEVGGLQVRDAAGHWHDVPPRPGAVVINAGDMLEAWSNGRYQSTWHRVLPRNPGQERFSIALFVDPDSDTVIEALPACIDDSNPPRYAPTTAGAHLQARIEATHLA